MSPDIDTDRSISRIENLQMRVEQLEATMAVIYADCEAAGLDNKLAVDIRTMIRKVFLEKVHNGVRGGL